MYKYITNDDNFGFNIISKINKNITNQANAFGKYNSQNIDEFNSEKKNLYYVLENCEYLSNKEQQKFLKFCKLIKTTDIAISDIEIKKKNINQPTLCMSLFYGNLQNFSGDKIMNFIFKYISTQIRAIIAFKTGFPNGNIKLLFDKFMMDKFSNEHVNFDGTISHHISDVDIDNKNKIVREILNYNTKIKSKIFKLENNDLGNIKINIMDKILLMYETAANVNDEKNMFIEMFAYEFNGLFTHDTISNNDIKITQAITNGYIGQLVRYLSVIQEDYLLDGVLYNKSKHIVIRDGHSVSPGKFDCDWINELNTVCIKNRKTISLLTYPHYYKKTWNGYIGCDKNVIRKSSPAGWSQFAMFDESRIFETKYKKIISLPFIISNDEKNIPFINFRNNKIHDMLKEKNTPQKILTLNSIFNYEYGIDEFLLSTLISNDVISQYQLLIEISIDFPSFNDVDEINQTITITFSFIILLYVYIYIFEKNITFLEYLSTNVFYDHLCNINKLQRFINHVSETKDETKEETKDETKGKIIKEINIYDKVINLNTLKSLFIFVYNKHTALNIIRVNDTNRITNINSLPPEELELKLVNKIKYYIYRHFEKNEKLCHQRETYCEIFLNKFIFWFQKKKSARQCESIFILMCLYCFITDKKSDINFIHNFNYENIVIFLLKMKKIDSDSIFRLFGEKLNDELKKNTIENILIPSEHFKQYYSKLFENISIKLLEIKETTVINNDDEDDDNEDDDDDVGILYDRKYIGFLKNEILQCINYELSNFATLEFNNLIGDFFQSKFYSAIAVTSIYGKKYNGLLNDECKIYDDELTKKCNKLIDDMLYEIHKNEPNILRCNTSYIFDASNPCKNKLNNPDTFDNFGCKKYDNIIKSPSDIQDYVLKFTGK